MLNTLRIASSLRGTPAKRNEGWKTGAKRNPMPAPSMQRATPSGCRSIFTPSFSSTSADPHSDDAALLPCLATRTPHAAATMAASVEMLKVASPSPPVPHVSRSAPSTSIGVATARAVRAKPVSSSAVSPFIRSATMKPAICDGVASPRMITSNADAASPSVRFSQRTSLAIASITSGVHLRGAADEVAEDLLALLRQHRLGMELHAVRRVLGVTEAHDDAVMRPGGDDELGRDARALDDQGVVPGGLERLAHAGQDAAVVVVDPGRLAVRRLVAHDLATEHLADALMTEAHAEDRHLAAERADGVVGDACVVRRARTWGDHDAVEPRQLVHGDLVIAEHLRLGAELGHVLDEVVGEGVVVVDHREAHLAVHGATSPPPSRWPGTSLPPSRTSPRTRAPASSPRPRRSRPARTRGLRPRPLCAA